MKETHNKKHYLSSIKQPPGRKKYTPSFQKSLLAVAILSCCTHAMAQSDEKEHKKEDDGLEIIEVTGQRGALESASILKRESTTIGDSIVLDEAGKVPSTSLLEILERAPGVTMNRIRAGGEGSPDGFSFEGSGVQVRGLNKTKTLINGHEVFSANGGQGLSWGDIGPELLKTVTVFKASRADLIEGGVSGTVNLETKMPFDHDGFKASAAVSASYGDFTEEATPAYSGMISDRFETDSLGEIGVLVDLAYSKIKSEDSNLITPPYYATNYNGKRAYVPGGIRQSQDQFERTRKGYYTAIQWQLTDNLEFYHTTFISERESVRDSQILSMEYNTISAFDGSEFDENDVFVRGAISSQNLESGLAVSQNSSYTPSFSKTRDHVTGFEYVAEDWSVSGSYQFNAANSNTGKYSLGNTVVGSNIIRTNMDMSGDRPAVDFNGQVLSTDPADTGLSRFNWLDSENTSDNHSVQLDGTYHIDGDFFKKVKVGGRVSNREESDSFVGTWWSATARGWNGVPRPTVATAPEGDFVLEEFSDFFKGDVASVGSVWVGSDQVNRADQFERVVNTYGACAPNLYYQCTEPGESNYLYGNPASRSFDQLPSFYTTNHKRKSAYVMFGFENYSNSRWTNFTGNFGFRWVKYDVESNGNFAFNGGGSSYYASQADAQASLEAMGGLENVRAWQEANPDIEAPLSQQAVGYETARTGSFSNDYILPSFNIKFEPAENWVARYAYTETLTPPSAGAIRAQGSANVQTTQNLINDQLELLYPGEDISVPQVFAGYTNVSGNPFLEPELAYNHDISIEWYPEKGSSMHLSLFHKTVKDYVTFNNFSIPAGEFFTPEELPQSEPANGDGEAKFLDGDVSSRTDFNAKSDATIKGFELGGRTYFDSLGGWMSGFGIDTNVTFIDGDSPDSFALDIDGEALDVPIIALSEWSYSATLLYDMDAISARLSYNWRDRYLTTTNDSSTTTTYNDPFSSELIQTGLPVYAAANARLDASISYKFTDTMNLKLNIQNLTDEDSRTEMEIKKGVFVDRGVFVTDRRISLHFGYSF